jgi:hypothetical protein
MSTNVQPNNNADGPIGGIVDQLANNLRSFRIGTDAEGAKHYYHRNWHAVVVCDGRELEYIQRLGARSLADWYDFVDERRGWYSFGPFADIGLEAAEQRREESR